MATVGYARVSTEGQNITAQVERLAAAGAQKIFQEKASATGKKREALATMLDYIREGDTVLVTRLDRIARSTQHLLQLLEEMTGKGVAFRVLNTGMGTSTPTGKLMFTLLGGIAEFERELMLERQAEGIARAKREGRYKGRKPTAKAKGRVVLDLLDRGHTKSQAAAIAGVSLSSAYRIAKEGARRPSP